MKKILALVIITILINASPALAANTQDDIVVKIEGMVCEACVQSLTKVFTKEGSVNAVNVSLEKHTVTIDEKESVELSDEKIKELIEWGGYDLISIKRN